MADRPRYSNRAGSRSENSPRLLDGTHHGSTHQKANAFLWAEYRDYQPDDRRLHRTGHGIGLGTHEGPCLAVGSGEVLAENQVVSIEPGISIPGVGGFRHSNTVRVTDRGHERLTCLPDDLASMMVLGWKPVTRLRA